MLKTRNPMLIIAGLLIATLLSQFAYAHGMSEAERQAIIAGGNLAYMQIGATHMLTGYDHLLFCFAILFCYFVFTFLYFIFYMEK